MKKLAICALIFALTCICTQTQAAELTIADFNGSGMNWTWGDFAWESQPGAVRIYDPVDSTGGAGRSTPGLDLSSFGDARWVIDVTQNAGNASNHFAMTLADSQSRRGTWTFNTTGLDSGAPTTVVSTTTLGNPTGGNDAANLDLSDISLFFRSMANGRTPTRSTSRSTTLQSPTK